jgi:hypothetical protein
MDKRRGTPAPIRQAERPEAYEPPRVEQVVTAEDIEREILYAGVSQ